MKKTIRFLITGVGGQGTILASDILAEVGLRLGHAQGEEQAVQRHGQRDGQAVAPGPPVEQLLRPQKGRIDAPALGQGVKLLCKRGDLCTGQLLPEGEQSVQIGVQQAGQRGQQGEIGAACAPLPLVYRRAAYPQGLGHPLLGQPLCPPQAADRFVQFHTDASLLRESGWAAPAVLS